MEVAKAVVQVVLLIRETNPLQPATSRGVGVVIRHRTKPADVNNEFSFVIPDPEAEGETLTFRYREIDPGSSVLADDIVIITGVIYNAKHERANDTMMKAEEEG